MGGKKLFVRLFCLIIWQTSCVKTSEASVAHSFNFVPRLSDLLFTHFLNKYFCIYFARPACCTYAWTYIYFTLQCPYFLIQIPRKRVFLKEFNLLIENEGTIIMDLWKIHSALHLWLIIIHCN